MKKILFVDDDTQTLTLMEKVAEILGHKGYTCPTASDALQYAAALCPDLILIDVNMQEMNGFDVVHQIRSFHGTSKMPVLILSASVPEMEEKHALEVGANGYIEKPLTLKNLSQAVQNYALNNGHTA